MNLKRNCPLLLLTFLSCCSIATAERRDEFASVLPHARVPQKESAPIAGTKVSLKPPDGFTPSPQFPGYWLESLSSSIMVTELPAPFAEATKGISDPAALMKRNMSLLSKENVTVDGFSGLLLQVKQNAFGSQFLKWLLIFGDENNTLLITATFPTEHEDKLSEKMKASLLTAKWDRNKDVPLTQGLNFAVSAKGEMKLTKRIANSLTFTRNGTYPSKDVDDPLFIVAQSTAKMEINSRQEFAKARIFKTATIKDFQIEQLNEVAIDALNGYEIVAIGKDQASATPMVVYQVMLFEEHSYFLMQGLISDRNREPALGVFKQMARTFKRKN